jgi:hypothetical protein
VSADQDEKLGHKLRRHDAKLRRDAELPPRSFERFRILADIVDEARRVTDMADHKARYALVVMGVLNAGVFFLLSRAHLVSSLSPRSRSRADRSRPEDQGAYST